MSAVNIYQKSWSMFETTVLGAVVACAFAIVGGCKKKEGIVGAGICVMIMFSFYAVIGGNDGFAILWILLIPASMPFLSFRSGMLVSSYFLIFLFLLFIHRAPKARILVVDDVEMNLKVVKGLLRETKMQIDTAMSGKACLKQIQRQSYDMIFLDHMMPEMDGIETLHQMRQEDMLHVLCR